jgi:hypothetical protein
MVIFDGICEVWTGDFSGQGRFDTVEYLRNLGDILLREEQ